MIDPAEVEQYVSNASDQVKALVKELAKKAKRKSGLDCRNLELTMSNIAALTGNLNKIMVQSQQNMNGLLANMNKITKTWQTIMRR